MEIDVEKLLSTLNKLKQEQTELEEKNKNKGSQFSHYDAFMTGKVSGKIESVENILTELGVDF